jgi:hypothetical protein
MPKKQAENPLISKIEPKATTMIAARIPASLYWQARALLPKDVKQNAQSLANYALWYLVEHKKGA